jgi:hypothetical protein
VTPEHILYYITEKLEKHKVDYMITGSFASNLHGMPRTTFDADIVIYADFEKIKNFLREIEKEFYTDSEMAREAYEHKGIFNIIHYETGFKVDLIVRKAGAYYENEFKRRTPFNFGNKLCFFASPEDTILSKLVWAKESESEKQLRDALGVAKIQREKLDYEYLKKWSKILNVQEELQKFLDKIE